MVIEELGEDLTCGCPVKVAFVLFMKMKQNTCQRDDWNGIRRFHDKPFTPGLTTQSLIHVHSELMNISGNETPNKGSPHVRIKLDMPLSKSWKKAKARRAILGSREQVLAEDPDIVPVVGPVNVPADRAPSAPVIGPVIVPADMVAGANDVDPFNVTAFRAQKAPDVGLVNIPAFRALERPFNVTANTTQCSNETNASYAEKAQIFPKNSNLNDRICTTSSAMQEDQSEIVNQSYCTGMPFSCLSLVFGSYSQANNRFSIETRGSQCTINSLCALIYAKYSDLITTENINEVLNIGDELYRNVVNNLKQLGRFKHRLLSLDEMPDQVNVLSKVVQIRKENIVSGMTIQRFGDTDLPTLHQALHVAFQTAHHALVMIGAICSALFDSHSHGEYGLSSFDGNSVLMAFDKLEDLVTFMYAMYESANIDIMSQYEILPLNFSVVECTSQYHNMYIKDQQKITDISKTDADDVWQTVSYKKQKKSSNFSVMPSNEQTHEVVKNSIKQQSVEHKVKTNTKTKNSNRRIKKEKVIDAYMRLYMQKQRQRDQFKIKDREFTLRSKRKARSDEAFRQKETDVQNKSKRKARSDEAFKQKEIELQNKSKRKARSDEAFKQKEIELQNKSKRKARSDEAFKQNEIEVQNKSKQKARSKRKARSEEAFRQKETDVQNKSKRKARLDPYTLEKERIAKQQRRLDERNKSKEKMLDCKRKSEKRKNPSFSEAEKITAKRIKRGNDIEECIAKFHQNIQVGPIYVCSSCHQTWFKESVSEVLTFTLKDKNKYLTGLKSVAEKEWICATCKQNIKKGRLPTLSVLNGIEWPTKPNELDLFLKNV
ncbi:hypothetical protein MAR_030043 [Mya arenaria]|uniref:Uncharacterized protein n=1 Tax=Mya arenaria TaxID=6604 RepID=A0ABY7DJH9_MYAAR|nr:hypothetical protein MAR_030043 [Mya arenaria]